MKRWLTGIVLASALAMASGGLAQEQTGAPLELRGKLLSLKLERNETWGLLYHASFLYRFVNTGERPVILQRRKTPVIFYSSADWQDSGSVDFSHQENQFEDAIAYESVNTPDPPKDETVIVKPGGEYSFPIEAEFDLQRNGPDDARFKQNLAQGRMALTLKSWPTILISSHNAETEDMDEDEVLALIQNRWKVAGDVVKNDVDAELVAFEIPIPAGVPQPTGLVLRGKLVGWEKPTNKEYVDLVAKLQLEFVNTGKRSVLVLKPEDTGYDDYWLGSVTLQGTTLIGGIDSTFWDNAAWPSRYNRDEFVDLRKAMGKAPSPEEHFWIIPPGGSHSFPASAQLRFSISHEKSRFPPEPSWQELQKVTADCEALWLLVEIEIWPFNLEPDGNSENPVFGRSLRSRWAKSGVLELGERGIVKSEQIPIRFPAVP